MQIRQALRAHVHKASQDWTTKCRGQVLFLHTSIRVNYSHFNYCVSLFLHYSYFEKSGKGEKLTELGLGDKILEKTRNDPKYWLEERGDQLQHHIFVRTDCHETQCTFEITLFEYKGPLAENRGPNVPPGSVPFEDVQPTQQGSMAGSIALIIPAHMMSGVDQERLQKFMDGHVAIQLRARVPENPIQFVVLNAGL